MANPYVTPQAPAQQGQVFAPQQDRRTTLLQMARIDPTLTPEQKAQLVTWLQGQAPLTDPTLYAWVTRGGESAAVPGAGPVQVPQAQQASAPSTRPGVGPTAGVPATTPPGVGGGQATGASAAGGLYQNYQASKAKALVGTGGRAIGPTEGVNSNPVAPNATNPTAAKPVTAQATSTPPAQEAPPMVQQPTAPGGGPLSTTTGAALAGPSALPDVQLREAVRQAGLDPNGGGLAAQYFAKLIQPIVASEGSLYGFGQPGGADYTQAGNFIGNLVKSFTTAGQNGYAGARSFAQNLLGNPNFTQQLGNVGDYQKQQQILQNLMPLLYGGSSGLEQAAAQHQADVGLSNYQDAAFGLGGQQRFGGNFTQYLAQTPQGQALARIFGMGG